MGVAGGSCDNRGALLRLPAGEPQFVPFTDTVTCAAFNFDSTLVAYGSYEGAVKVLTADRVLQQDIPSFMEMEWLAFHPQGNLLVGGGESMVAIWHAGTRKEVTSWVEESRSLAGVVGREWDGIF